MRNIFMLAAANIRKNKSQAISLSVFVLIAAVFLNCGLLLYFGFGSYFEARAEELNAPHLSIAQSADTTTSAQLKWLGEHPQTVEIEHYPVALGYPEYFMNGSKTVAVAIISDITAKQAMNRPLLIGESLPLTDGHIFLPYIMSTAGGHTLGGEFVMFLEGTEYSFEIAGFTEEITFGDTMNQFFRFYITSHDLAALKTAHPQLEWDLISLRLKDPDYSSVLQAAYAREFFFAANEIEAEEPSSQFIQSRSYNGVVGARTFIPGIVALTLTALSFVLLAVCLIVMRFGIINNIDENMVNIGALKAVGFRNNQILGSIIMQFGGLAAVGGVIGITLSVIIMPLISGILETLSALKWNPGFNPAFASLTFSVVLLSVVFVSFIAARCIYRFHPLTALRGGILTHNFKKNRFPLDKSRGSLSLILALKSLAKAKGQNVMIGFIIAVLSFASVVGVTIHNTFGGDITKFVTIIAGEFSDMVLTVSDDADTDEVISRLLFRPEVRKAFVLDNSVHILADNIPTMAIVTDDFSLLEGNMLVEGRYPKHHNEVAAGNNYLRTTGLKIGDTVTIAHKGIEKEFLITGLSQGSFNDGINLLMTREAALTVRPDYEIKQVYVYVEESVDMAALIESVKISEGSNIGVPIDLREVADAQFGPYGTIFSAVSAAIMIITAVVVSLVLYLVIKTAILRRKREFGIQKAVGFTNMQIINQIALTYTPIVAVSVLIGGIAGAFGLNPMFAALTSGIGIVRADFDIPVSIVALTCASLILLALIVSMLIALRIRKISAYSLVTE